MSPCCYQHSACPCNHIGSFRNTALPALIVFLLTVMLSVLLHRWKVLIVSSSTPVKVSTPVLYCLLYVSSADSYCLLDILVLITPVSVTFCCSCGDWFHSRGSSCYSACVFSSDCSCFGVPCFWLCFIFQLSFQLMVINFLAALSLRIPSVTVTAFLLKAAANTSVTSHNPWLKYSLLQVLWWLQFITLVPASVWYRELS